MGGGQLGGGGVGGGGLPATGDDVGSGELPATGSGVGGGEILPVGEPVVGDDIPPMGDDVGGGDVLPAGEPVVGDDIPPMGDGVGGGELPVTSDGLRGLSGGLPAPTVLLVGTERDGNGSPGGSDSGDVAPAVESANLLDDLAQLSGAYTNVTPTRRAHQDSLELLE